MKQSTIAKIVLFLTAVLWGSTFTIGKLASEVFSPSFLIAFRFHRQQKLPSDNFYHAPVLLKRMRKVRQLSLTREQLSLPIFS